MAKIKLGARPKSFKHKVTVAMPEGGDGVIEVVYKYRTRKEFGEFLDGILAEAKIKAVPKTDDEVALSLAEALARTSDANADMILQIAEGWDLEHEFNHANVAQLCDELPGVAMAIINDYRMAVAEGRLGN
jgi:hypothetical protein